MKGTFVMIAYIPIRSRVDFPAATSRSWRTCVLRLDELLDDADRPVQQVNALTGEPANSPQRSPDQPASTTSIRQREEMAVASASTSARVGGRRSGSLAGRRATPVRHGVDPCP